MMIKNDLMEIKTGIANAEVMIEADIVILELEVMIQKIMEHIVVNPPTQLEHTTHEKEIKPVSALHVELPIKRLPL